MQSKYFNACLIGAAGAVLVACGGGGGGGGDTQAPPVAATATGVFKDANVVGLNYVSGTHSGVTGADGSFTYEVGKTVTFSVGKVTLGTANGKALITPTDLIANGTSSSVQVQNIARFLMMLDADGDPVNGITISANVASRAQNWTAVDFTTGDLAGALSFIMSDAISADAGTHLLPSAATAQAHLEASFRCAFAGYFDGTYGGGDSGGFNLFIDTAGFMHGFAHSTTTPGLVLVMASANPVSAAQTVAFIAGPASNGTTFSGSFSDSNMLSGTWNGSGVSGTFSGTRKDSQNPVYRFTGTFNVTSPVSITGAAYFVYDIDSANNVSAVSYDWQGDTVRQFTTTLNGTTLNFGTVGNGGTAQVDLAAGTLSGTWSDSTQGSSGTFSGTGCRLN